MDLYFETTDQVARLRDTLTNDPDHYTLIVEVGSNG